MIDPNLTQVKKTFNPPTWTISAIIIAFLIAIPILFVLGSIFVNTGDVWQHLASTVLIKFNFTYLWIFTKSKRL